MDINIKNKITSSDYEYKKFLNFSANMFSYSFDEQLKIYAANPDATAVATLEQWNRYGRRVKFREKSMRISYKKRVFDITQTHGDDFKLWEYDEKYNNVLYDRLENVNQKVKLNRFISFTENIYDYISDMAKRTLNQDSLPQSTIQLIIDTATYTVVKRLGADMDNVYFDFRNISEDRQKLQCYYSAVLDFWRCEICYRRSRPCDKATGY